VTNRPAFWRARHGLVLAPESRGIFPSLTVDENLSVWLRSRAEVDAALARFTALAQRRTVHAGNLSGGEQQLLTLAPLLVRPPRVLIADEPTLGLAPLVVSNLLDLFRTLRDDGVAVLLVEEKVRSLLELADVVSLLQLGRIVWTGHPDAVDDAELAAAYLGAARSVEAT
jgi:ABC-type branched-subunit amino acid transport system ATPase component